MRADRGHFQLRLHFWVLDGIMTCLIRLAVMIEKKLLFQVSKLELRCKSDDRRS
jgi:hypothetical protein